jgi:hypothetical protein
VLMTPSRRSMFGCLLVADVVVDRSTTGRISGGFNGNWVDRHAAQGTGADPLDEKNHRNYSGLKAQ